MKNEILYVVGTKETVSLKEFYALLPQNKASSVRGTLNLMVKKGELKRVSKGVYSK